METLYQINREIFELRQKKDFKAALDLYKSKIHSFFTTEEIRETDFLVANILFCLRKTGQEEAGFRFIHATLQLQPQWDENPQTCNEYGWLLYQLVKSIDPARLLNEIPNYIILATKFIKTIDPEKDYLLISLLFSELSKKLMQKGVAVELLISLFEFLPYDVFKGPAENADQSLKTPGQEREKASDLESYLVRKVKAFLLAGRYEQCIEACHTAFEKIERFHHGNHVWLARNLAISLQQTGKTREAILKMEEIIKKKKDWFLYQELAAMHFTQDNNQKALNCIVAAALQQGHSPYKAGLYEQMGFSYKEQLGDELACKHVWLAIKTRTDQQWKLPQQLIEHSEKHKCIEPGETTVRLYAQLSEEWKKIVNKDDTDKKPLKAGGLHAEGSITRILNEGENGDGFITTSDGKSVYFRFKKFLGEPKLLNTSCHVKVFAQTREYKGKQVYNALWVKPLEGKIVD